MKQKRKVSNIIWITVLTVASLFWIYPIVMILFNSLKKETAISTSTAFTLPTADTFAGISNYVSSLTSQGFLKSLGYSALITVTSVAAILLCCSMCAWCITRLNGVFSKIIYYMCVLSMVVPFQMVMFTLSQTADKLKLNTPFNIWVIYLGFGAGLAVFMFCGFVKSIPIEIEEAAMIDGCNPLQTFFMVVVPILKPTMISVGVLEAMWVWNDYLLPYLVIGVSTPYKTIPVAVQYLMGSYGAKDYGSMMALLVLAIIPIIAFYLFCQKYIIEGVVAGAVKG